MSVFTSPSEICQGASRSCLNQNRLTKCVAGLPTMAILSNG